MKKFLESIYYKLPLPLKNIAITAFGYYWYNHRFGGNFKEQLKLFKDRESYTKQQWKALGLIIISTNVGGIVSLLKDKENALLVDSNNHEDMAKAIVQILENSTLAVAMQDNARKKTESFSWDHINPLWEDLLFDSRKKV